MEVIEDTLVKCVRLGDYVKIRTGKLDANANVPTGKYPFFTCAIEPLRIDTFSYDCECVLVAGNGDLNVKYYSGKFDAYQRTYIVESSNAKKLNTHYLYCFLSNYVFELRNQSIGGVIKYIKLENLTEIQIPLPSMDAQLEIAAILEHADNARQKRKQANKLTEQFLQSAFIEMFGDPVKNEKGWEVKELGLLGKWRSGGTPSRKKAAFFIGNIPWYTSGELNEMYISASQEHISKEAIEQSAAKLMEPGSLLLGMYDTAALKSSIAKIPSACNQAIAFSELEATKANTVYVYFTIQMGREFYRSQQRGVRQKNMNLEMIKGLNIPIPPLPLQQKFAALVEKVEKLREKQRQSEAELENLFGSLMQQYFG